MDKQADIGKCKKNKRESSNIGIILPHIASGPGGGFKVIFEYANYLAGKGDMVTVYFMTYNLYQCWIKWPFLRKIIGKLLYKRYKNWFKLAPEIRTYALFDKEDLKYHEILIATGVKTALLTNELCLAGIKLAYFVQGFETWEVDEKTVFETYQFPMKKIVVSKWLENKVKECCTDKVEYIPNTIDLSIFRMRVPVKERKAHTIIFHYRTMECKGSKYAIELIRKLEKLYTDLEVKVIGVSKYPKELPDSCKYYRSISPKKVALLNNTSRIFICTSLDEGFGLPGLEAMACGCAVVTTDFAGGREYAIDGYNALISKPKDVTAMIENVIRLFKNEDLLNQISSNGIITSKKFEFSKSAESFRRIIKSL
jgi:glycosyltransferase involved in cell wall biosynthesis